MGRPPIEPPLSKDCLPLLIAANRPNGAISSRQIFNRILFDACNDGYFGVQNPKKGDGGTIVFTTALERGKSHF